MQMAYGGCDPARSPRTTVVATPFEAILGVDVAEQRVEAKKAPSAAQRRFRTMKPGSRGCGKSKVVTW